MFNRCKQISNKFARGFTLVEVMIVLAISGILVVAAIGTFNNRSAMSFQTNIRQLASSIQTVANEAKSGLGPTTICNDKQVGASGSGDADDDIIQVDNNTNEASSCPSTPDPIFPNGHVAIGQALHFDFTCGSSEHCLRVIKLAQDPNDDTSVYAYERYRIDFNSQLNLDPSSSTYSGTPVLDEINPSTDIMIVYLNDGRAFLFGKNSNDNIVDSNYIGDAKDRGQYTRDGVLILGIAEDGSNRSATLTLDLRTPTNVEVKFP